MRRFLSLVTLILGMSLGPKASALWVSGYYVTWDQTYLAPNAIDFTALTHVIHFALTPNNDGTVSGISGGYANSLITYAHRAGVKVILCVGGASTQSGFESATSAAHLATFTNQLLNFVATYNYDGIDIDWEPLSTSDTAQFTSLVNSLRAGLNTYSPHRLLTAAAGGQPKLFATLQNQFDQINVMTYDLSGPWGGWVTWYNSPIYNGGYTFPSTGGQLPCADSSISSYISAGVPANKLGIGIAFYGYVWSGGAGTSTGGVSQPRQSWTTAPTASEMDYRDIMSTYFQSNLYHFDSVAQAAYLGIDNPGTNDHFIAYDDERVCQAKVSYARNRGLGGVMIWELASGYRSTQPSGQRDPLLQAVRQAVATPGKVSLQTSGQDVQLNFSGAALGSYRVQRSTSLSSGGWGTVTITNVPGGGGTLTVTDPGALTNRALGFYRVQTPP